MPQIYKFFLQSKTRRANIKRINEDGKISEAFGRIFEKQIGSTHFFAYLSRDREYKIKQLYIKLSGPSAGKSGVREFSLQCNCLNMVEIEIRVMDRKDKTGKAVSENTLKNYPGDNYSSILHSWHQCPPRRNCNFCLDSVIVKFHNIQNTWKM